MIHFILVQNRQGKTRLAKWYSPMTPHEQLHAKETVHQLTSERDQKGQSNFIEYKNMMLVYRRYAGLFFSMAVDNNDNLLACLESIHFFVEVLDSFFGNVCELDLVFNFYKVYAILDEFFLGGEVSGLSRQQILSRLDYLDKMDG